jgi:ribose-phosphate pyrophosphokinase
MNGFVICAARSMKAYAGRVINHLSSFPVFSGIAGNFSGVDLLRTDSFADGEIEVVVNSSIRGKDVIIFTSSARNEAGISVNEAKIELYHAVDALKRSQAAKIIVFEPFASCSRSDRTTRRGSVGLWIHIKTLISLGVSHYITYQLHSDKSKSMVDPVICSFDDIPALNLLKRYLCDTYIKNLGNLEKTVKPQWAFCSVDAGAEKLARGFANAFGAPLVIAHKQRDTSALNAIESIHILSAEPVKDKVLWIVDDMVDTAASVQALINALIPLGPKEINLLAVHALLSPPAVDRLSALSRDGILKRIIVTDTVCCPQSLSGQLSNIEVVASAELSAQIISAIVTKTSMSRLLQPFNAAKYLNSLNLF